MLTIKQACEVSGVEPQTLRNWISSELIEPASRGGVGRSNPHEFSITQVIGLVVAVELKRHEQRPCALSYVGLIVEAFGNIDEEWLRSTLKNGKSKYLVTIHQGKPLIQDADPRWEWPNVFKAYNKVVKYTKKKGKR